VIHVTHDQVEAMTMGERICIMNAGRIVQVGRPMEVYRDPADTFVAGFLASPPMNLLEARIEADGAAGGLVVTCAAALRLPLSAADDSALGAYRDRLVILGIRPEDLREECTVPGMHPVDLQVVAVEALGPEAILIGSLSGPRAPELAARMGADFSARVGTEQRLWLDPAAVHLFDAATGKAIPRPHAAPRDSRSDHALRSFQPT
jgi:ABC-type sugar transport system ATPase subunit